MRTCLVADYLRPAAVRAGVLAKDSPHRFGFHNLRHSLASFLVRTKTDPKTVRALLRHAYVKTTLQHTLTACQTIGWRRKGWRLWLSCNRRRAAQ